MNAYRKSFGPVSLCLLMFVVLSGGRELFAAHVIVDDMESYTIWSTPGNNIFEAWRNGAGNCEFDHGNGTGSTVTENTMTVLDGLQSMKYDFDNDGLVYSPCSMGQESRPHLYSRIEGDINTLPSGIGSDWTVIGVKFLRINFYGQVDNSTTEPFWVLLQDASKALGTKVFYGDHQGEDLAHLAEESWHEWNIDIADFNVDLSNVYSIFIGIGNEGSSVPGGSGTLYIDEIELFSPVFVDTDAMGANNGTSWTDAFNHLQDGLAAADPDNKIFVAQGTYHPDEDTNDPCGTGNRTATFGLISGVALYGGFPSGGDDFGDRDPNRYETILSGDLLENDGPDFDNNGENSYHVVTASGVDPNTILDGFTITAGNTDGGCFYGAGMYNVSSSPTIKNCFFTRNTANSGGGMANDQSSNPLVTNCLFVDNSVGTAGGAMSNMEVSNPEIVNCFFAGNESLHYGGAMVNHPSANPILTNCVFTSNTAGESGGAIATGGTSSPVVINCTFSANTAGLNAGAIGSGGPDFTIVNSIFWGNSAPTEPQIGSSDPCSVLVSFSDVQGGWPGTGNIDLDPQFKDPNGPDDIAGTEDDNLELAHDSPCIDTADSNSMPPDYADLDTNGDTSEVTPLDLAGRARFTDDPVMADTGAGTPPIVDMGAYERYEFCGSAEFQSPPGDLTGPDGVPDCDVNLYDIAVIALHWLEYTGPE